MMTNDSLTSQWSDKKMEGDKDLRTVECLRGRLLAERAASKAANDESEQISKKVVELEKLLKMEIKSRNKAEKRLRFLVKKLETLNISYVSADEYSSSISEKSGISSVSSSKSLHQAELEKNQLTNISKCVKETDTHGERHNCPSHEANMGSVDEAISEDSNENVTQSNQKDDEECNSQKEENNGSRSFLTFKDNQNEEQDQDTYANSMALVVIEDKSITTPRNDNDDDDDDDDDICDNSMALVVVDSTMKEEKKNVSISNGNVKDVLDALKYARECLQTSMDVRSHMKSNIAHHRLDRISC